MPVVKKEAQVAAEDGHVGQPKEKVDHGGDDCDHSYTVVEVTSGDASCSTRTLECTKCGDTIFEYW